MRLIALALLARELVLMTGPPGTAKSGIAAAALGRIVDERRNLTDKRCGWRPAPWSLYTVSTAAIGIGPAPAPKHSPPPSCSTPSGRHLYMPLGLSLKSYDVDARPPDARKLDAALLHRPLARSFAWVRP